MLRPHFCFQANYDFQSRQADAQIIKVALFLLNNLVTQVSTVGFQSETYLNLLKEMNIRVDGLRIGSQQLGKLEK